MVHPDRGRGLLGRSGGVARTCAPPRGVGQARRAPLHADRLEGRALFAAGDPTCAVAPLERAAAGFASLGARWEVALTELSLGEALVALGRSDDAAQALERAAGEFARLRVPRELERARGLLAGLRD